MPSIRVASCGGGPESPPLPEAALEVYYQLRLYTLQVTLYYYGDTCLLLFQQDLHRVQPLLATDPD
jgi:hypothetical protein